MSDNLTKSAETFALQLPKEITVTRDLKRNKDATAFETVWTFDLSGLDADSAVNALVGSGIVIPMQAKARASMEKGHSAQVEWAKRRFVLPFEKSQRIPLTPMEAAKRAVASMTDAERAALLKQLQESQS